MKKENKGETQESCNEKEKQNVPLSDTIKNAHAAGDGAMERANDSMLKPEEDEDFDGMARPGKGESY